MAKEGGNPQNLTLAGKNVGNKGGTGRPPSQLRAACREGFAQGIDAALKIVKGEQVKHGNPDPDYGDVLKAFDLLGKYGMGEAKAVIEDDLLKCVATVMAKYLEPQDIEPAVGELVEALKALY